VGGKQCSGDELSPPKSGCLGDPQRVTVDSDEHVYVTDEELGAVIRIGENPHSFVTITTGSRGASSGSSPKQSPQLKWPTGVVIDSSGVLFFNDQTLSVVFRLSLPEGAPEVLAGALSQFRNPDGLAIDGGGNLYIADYGNCRIQKVDSRTRTFTTVVGTQDDGSSCERLPESAAISDQPSDVAVDQNNCLYFVQPWRGLVRRVNLRTGVVATAAGNGTQGLSGDGELSTKARLHYPKGIAVDQYGNLYIADTNNNRVRRVDAKTGMITTFAGHGQVVGDLML